MTEIEIRNEIARLEHRKDLLSFKDRWSSDDYALNRDLAQQIRALKIMLEG